ncbi:MAG: CoA transferase [Actinobacteria bacterium]|nr:CoA transferase [Actinomycetota bacterium]
MEVNSPTLLAGTRILDLCDGIGGLAGRFLAELGADVIMVEPPGGFAIRSAAPVVDRLDPRFVTESAGKRSVTIDQESSAGRSQLAELVKSSHTALVTAGAGGSAGARAEALREIDPRLVVVAITPFGLWGPYRDFRGSDAVYAALGGLLAQSGVAGSDPLVPPRGIVESSAAVQAAWATIVALNHADRSGEGQLVDLSVFEAVTQIIDPPFGVIGSARAAMDPSLAEATSRGRPDVPYLYPNVRCKDGYVRIAILGTRQWQGLWRCIGSPPELAGEHFEKLSNRFLSWELIRGFIEDFFAPRSVRELLRLGEEHKFPVGEVLDLQAASNTLHLAERGAFAPVTLPSGTEAQIASGFVEIDGFPRRPDPVAVQPGRDNGILAESRRRPDRVRDRGAAAGTVRAAPSRLAPLAGLRILDLGVIVVGAESGRLLADLGADVVKVENLRYPDGLRIGPAGPTVTPTFAWGHRNKRSVGIDLRSSAGRELFGRLVGEADAVLSNFKAGTLDSLGIGFEALAEINPKIVVGESSAYGATGEWSGRMGYGPLVRGSVGLADLWRDPDQPAGFGDSVTVFPDHANARVMAAAIVAGVMRAARTGRGCRVASAQAETIINLLGSEYLRDSLEPGTVRAVGNRSAVPDVPCLYRCAGDDEWCVVDFEDEAQLQAVLELAGGEPSAPAAERIAGWASQKDKREVMWACQAVGVPAGAMSRPMEIGDDVHLRTRGHFSTLRQPGLPDLPAEGGPALFSTIARPELRPAPRFGEHTREVLQDWLHLRAAEIDRLAAAEVLQLDSEGEAR